MTFVLKLAAPARGRNAPEMLRHTGFGLQGCLLFCTQRGSAIGPGIPDSESVGPGRKKAACSRVRTAAVEGGSGGGSRVQALLAAEAFLAALLAASGILTT